MATHKDKLGTNIIVGDVVVYANGSYANLSIGMVTKRNPIMVCITGNSNVHPGQCLVITDKYKSEFSERYNKLYSRSKPKFKEDVKAKNPAMRYKLRVKGMEGSKRVCLVVSVLTDGIVDIPVEQLGNFSAYDAKVIARRTNGEWNRGVTDSLRLVNSYYNESPKTLNLPTKLMLKFFNSVPSQSCILRSFDDMNECNEYLRSIGVDV